MVSLEQIVDYIYKFVDYVVRYRTRKGVKVALTEITGSKASELLTAMFPNARIHISDGILMAPRWQDFKNWLATDSLNTMLWLGDAWDCDNFALESKCRASNKLAGNIAYGFMWFSVPAHAINVVITSDDGILKIRQIEPQRDDSVTLPHENCYLIVM